MASILFLVPIFCCESEMKTASLASGWAPLTPAFKQQTEPSAERTEMSQTSEPTERRLEQQTPRQKAQSDRREGWKINVGKEQRG